MVSYRPPGLDSRLRPCPAIANGVRRFYGSTGLLDRAKLAGLRPLEIVGGLDTPHTLFRQVPA